MERYKIIETLLEQSSSVMNSLNFELKSLRYLPLITKDIEELLKESYELKVIDNQIKLETKVSKGSMIFKVPISKNDQVKNELLWYAPMFLSCLSSYQFF